MSPREKEIGRAIAAFARQLRKTAKRRGWSQAEVNRQIADYARELRGGRVRFWWPR